MTKVNASVKYGKGYDEPWITFEGEDPDAVRGLIISAFSLDVDSSTSLATVVTMASQAAQGVQNVSRDLKASVVEEVKTNGSTDPSATVSDGGKSDPDSGSDPSASADSDDAIAELFAKAESGDALRALWAEHKAAYARSQAIQKAYKARGKELTGG